MHPDHEDDHEKPAILYPKKRFGQHFLVDKNVIRKIVAIASIKEGDCVLEIGPGKGALTEGLIEAGAKVTAIEVDRDLAALLKRKFPENLEVITGDALKASFLELAEGRGCRFKLVSNLPYNISGPILAKFLSERKAFSLLVLMFQKEVAERLVAPPGTKEYGVLSVFTQAFTEIKKELDVSRNLFSPRPKVDSAVVSLKVLDKPRVEIRDEDFFKKVVRASFGTRRKMLSNALKALGFEKDVVERALEEAGIDPKRRGETLDLKEFGRLTDAFLEIKGREA
ncbi:MAG: ribosomal RNA small subunit methyltransferase A [Deltaproteobacteria bacterium]|nr:ribosomal RNA small subunit methyltransferase A [Deltaproteobacteria bacterium]